MREVKFRGLNKSSKEWKYGFLIVDEKYTQIWQQGDVPVIVDPRTIGQYTGLEDKSGKEIYEDDVVEMKGLIAGHFEPIVGYVYYESPSFVVVAIEPEDIEGKGRILSKRNLNEIIGNIHENPELLSVA